MEQTELLQLIKQAKSGDQQAFDALLQEAHTSVSYQCRKMLPNEQDAEDMTQEILLTVYTKLDTLQEPAAFWKWLSRITSTRCMNALSRSHVDLQFAEDEDGNSVLDELEDTNERQIPDKALDNAETARMIDEIVSELPEAQRMTTLLYYFDEMSVKEIAQTMGVNENAVKGRLNLARKAIKSKVEDYEKQGIKLYSVSVLPLLWYFLRKTAQTQANSEAAAACAAAVMGAGATAAAVGGSVAAGSTAAAATTAATVTAGVSFGKIVAGILAAALALGGIGFGVSKLAAPAPSEPTTTAHSHSYTEAVTAPGCTEKGYTTYTCACGDTYTGKAVAALGHAWSEWMATAEPTEETEGAAERSCSACAEKETKKLAPLSHTHVYTEAVTAPTCTERGYTTYTCKCGDTYTDHEVAALGHQYTSTVTAPTCTDDGETLFTCTCGYSYKEPIAKLAHSYTAVVTTPTCTDGGYTTHTCACGDTYTDQTTPATGHKYIAVVTAPTCTQKGYTTHTCICGESYQNNETDIVAHNYDENGQCATCDRKVSVGLEYYKVEGEDAYGVIGIGTCTDEIVVVPEVYNGMPVTYFWGIGSDFSELILPDSLTGIGEGAFANCVSLTSFVIPKNVTSIAFDAFSGCTNLTSVALPDGLQHIASGAFYGCTNLQSIVFPESFLEIGGDSFKNCTSLTSVYIPKNTMIWGNAFAGCSSLYEIRIASDHESYKSEDGVWFSKDGTTLMAYPAAKSDTSLTIPAGVTYISENAFIDCNNLQEIIVDPNNTMYCSIDGVLYDKNASQLIYYPGGKTDTSYVMPESITSVNNLSCSALESITISDELYLYDNIFIACPSLKEILVTPTNSSYCSVDGILFSVNMTKLIAYPRGKQESIYTVADGVTHIGAYAFSNCTNLLQIVLPEGVAKYGNEAFSGCTNLTSIHIPFSTKKFSPGSMYAERLFKDCVNLKEIHYAGTMTQWEDIGKISGWDRNTGDYIIYCTDGSIPKGEA